MKMNWYRKLIGCLYVTVAIVALVSTGVSADGPSCDCSTCIDCDGDEDVACSIYADCPSCTNDKFCSMFDNHPAFSFGCTKAGDCGPGAQVDCCGSSTCERIQYWMQDFCTGYRKVATSPGCCDACGEL